MGWNLGIIVILPRKTQFSEPLIYRFSSMSPNNPDYMGHVLSSHLLDELLSRVMYPSQVSISQQEALVFGVSFHRFAIGHKSPDAFGVLSLNLVKSSLQWTRLYLGFCWLAQWFSTTYKRTSCGNHSFKLKKMHYLPPQSFNWVSDS